MPFKTETLSKPKDHEPLGRSMGDAIRQVKQMTPGSELIAAVGEQEVPVEGKPKSLTAEEATEKAAIVKMILGVVEPPLLSKRRPNLIADKISFQSKVKAMTLEDLRRFVPEGYDARTIDPTDVSEDFKLTLEMKYKDLSP